MLELFEAEFMYRFQVPFNVNINGREYSLCYKLIMHLMINFKLLAVTGVITLNLII